MFGNSGSESRLREEERKKVLVLSVLLQRHVSEQNILLAALCDWELLADYILGLLLYPEDGGTTILQKSG
jgi:hypothetical protein